MNLRRQLHESLNKIDGIKVLPDSKINLTVAYSEKYDLRPVIKALHTKTHWSVVTEGDPSPVGVCICTMPQNDGQVQAFAEAFKDAIEKHAVPIGSLPDDYDFNLYGLDLD